MTASYLHSGFDRRPSPLFAEEVGAPSKASMLKVVRCDPQFARDGVAAWHSRLPKTQPGPWMLGFAAHYEETCFGVALWNNPSARTLPNDWLELRRLAVPPDAPHCTASRMLGQMARWIKRNMPTVPTLISYQDCDVHIGTIYRAAGWTPAYTSKPRVRDRSKPRIGTRRDYRNNLNGVSPDAAAKVRWQLELRDTRLGLRTVVDGTTPPRSETGVAEQVYDPFGAAQLDPNTVAA